MSIDSVVVGSPEHQKEICDKIREAVINYNTRYKIEFPPEVVVIGDNWFYVVALSYRNGEPQTKVEEVFIREQTLHYFRDIIEYSLIGILMFLDL